ncbi:MULTISPECIES: ScbR family autoregulator-binding transcription factor [Streptomyces]|uniref:ScbR family autoregulator-binding transcription factor n=1 Tax=Streptomyces TaxID=1883 RepID=UPI00163C9870|nr:MULTISPECIES: ScbR family autoregulator-binding transcription factor [Streptomyces]MBC2877821.1 TetR/AcrR family transcriptional regulator [Streptomyces sp. TYQ1024]UBI37961.1 TetR/AcrR family transcriptional regulator [Streptomyces mobaraensis]UKW30547.1 TetR/AcrR family transcriptional regulator [Streptomyces sp. TYQ1024]
MAKQDRAIRTRRTILEAAAAVFDERGYDAATITEILTRAEVTKGALYFHFASKEDLALAVIDAQLTESPATLEPLVTSRMQQLVDMGLVFAHRLRTDPLLRGSVRLTLEHGSTSLNRSGPFHGWSQVHSRVLTEGKERGEVLPHVVPADTAELIVGAYAGINIMSQVVTGRADLERRAISLYEHVMPSVAVPSVLARLDIAPGRGARALAEAERLRADETTGPAPTPAPVGVG